MARFFALVVVTLALACTRAEQTEPRERAPAAEADASVESAPASATTDDGQTARTETETETGPETGTETGTETGSGTESQTESGTESETESESTEESSAGDPPKPVVKRRRCKKGFSPCNGGRECCNDLWEVCANDNHCHPLE